MKFNTEDIVILLENSIIQPSENYNFTKKDNTDAFGNKTPTSVEVEEDLSGIEFINAQVISLQKLFFQLSPKDKQKFIKYLLGFLDKSNKSPLAAIAFSTLIHVGFFVKAFTKITRGFVSYYDNDFYIKILVTLGELLKNEWNIFTREEIDLIYSWTWKTHRIWAGNILYEEPLVIIDLIYRKLNIIKNLDLRNRIFIGTSQEITSDEKALKLEFKRYNFPDDLSETLDKIEFKISTATDNFDFQACMGLIRSFSERLFRHIAETLDSKNGKNINEKDSDQVAKFFTEKKLISDEQGKLLIALRHFLSNEGVHRLKSRADDARLSRNMMIELSLYLILRMKDLTE